MSGSAQKVTVVPVRVDGSPRFNGSAGFWFTYGWVQR